LGGIVGPCAPSDHLLQLDARLHRPQENQVERNELLDAIIPPPLPATSLKIAVQRQHHS
jgi:hypothetical protein